MRDIYGQKLEVADYIQPLHSSHLYIANYEQEDSLRVINTSNDQFECISLNEDVAIRRDRDFCFLPGA